MRLFLRILVFLFLGPALSGLDPGVLRAESTVFSTPHFVNPGEFSLGLEPVIVLSSGAGIGVNARFTEGLSDLTDVTAILGTGSGPRRFRVGGNATFDFFPDVAGQPGIGLAAQAIYYRLPNAGQLEITGIPYIHKAFPTGHDQAVEPYFGFPIGFGFSDGTYKVVSNVSVGAIIKNSEHFSYVAELGVNVNNSESYISGGIVYFH